MSFGVHNKHGNQYFFQNFAAFSVTLVLLKGYFRLFARFNLAFAIENRVYDRSILSKKHIILYDH